MKFITRRNYLQIFINNFFLFLFFEPNIVNEFNCLVIMDIFVIKNSERPHNGAVIYKINQRFSKKNEILSIKYHNSRDKSYYRYIFKNKKSKERWSKELSKSRAVSVTKERKTNYILKRTLTGKYFLYQSSHAMA